MRTPALIAATAAALATLATTSCYYGAVGSLHDVHVDEAKGYYAWCLAPSGQAVAWSSTGRDAMGRTYGTCAPPNRFVHVYACQRGGADLEAPPNGVRGNVRGGQVEAGASPAALAARVRASADNSLVGDSFEGTPFCAPHPPN